MTNTRKKIYLFIFTVLIISLSVCIFHLISLNKKNIPNPQPNTVTPTVTPFQATQITWTEAVNLIQNCQIRIVFQRRNLEVTLTSKDDRTYKSKEPKFNDIFNEANHLRSDCNDLIQTITE